MNGELLLKNHREVVKHEYRRCILEGITQVCRINLGNDILDIIRDFTLKIIDVIDEFENNLPLISLEEAICSDDWCGSLVDHGVTHIVNVEHIEQIYLTSFPQLEFMYLRPAEQYFLASIQKQHVWAKVILPSNVEKLVVMNNSNFCGSIDHLEELREVVLETTSMSATHWVLTHLPAQIEQLTVVNHKFVFTYDFSHLTDLTTLKLQNCTAENWKGMKFPSTLTELDLSGSNFSGNLKHLVHLHSLNLQGCDGKIVYNEHDTSITVLTIADEYNHISAVVEKKNQTCQEFLRSNSCMRRREIIIILCVIFSCLLVSLLLYFLI